MMREQPRRLVALVLATVASTCRVSALDYFDAAQSVDPRRLLHESKLFLKAVLLASYSQASLLLRGLEQPGSQ